MLARSSLNTEILRVFKDILRRCIAEEASQADRGRQAGRVGRSAAGMPAARCAERWESVFTVAAGLEPPNTG